MQIGLLFWIIFVVMAIFGGWSSFPWERRSGAFFAVLVLIFLLGWRVFGFVVQN